MHPWKEQTYNESAVCRLTQVAGTSEGPRVDDSTEKSILLQSASSLNDDQKGVRTVRPTTTSVTLPPLQVPSTDSMAPSKSGRISPGEESGLGPWITSEQLAALPSDQVRIIMGSLRARVWGIVPYSVAHIHWKSDKSPAVITYNKSLRAISRSSTIHEATLVLMFITE